MFNNHLRGTGFLSKYTPNHRQGLSESVFFVIVNVGGTPPSTPIKADSGCEFAIHIQADGSMQVSGIHPYDETEYHWASKPADDADWQIIRNGKRCACLPAAYSVLQVIEALLKADKAANLKPTKAIW